MLGGVFWKLLYLFFRGSTLTYWSEYSAMLMVPAYTLPPWSVKYGGILFLIRLQTTENLHRHWGGSLLDPNRIIAKDVKRFTYCCYVRCATFIVWVGEIPWSQTGTTHYHAQLRLPDKGRAIKGLVVCNSWDLEP